MTDAQYEKGVWRRLFVETGQKKQEKSEAKQSAVKSTPLPEDLGSSTPGAREFESEQVHFPQPGEPDNEREAGSEPSFERVPEYEAELGNPFKAAAGRSLDLKSLEQLGSPGCSGNLLRLFRSAVERRAIRTGSVVLVRMEDVAEAIFSGQSGDRLLEEWRTRAVAPDWQASPAGPTESRDVETLVNEGKVILRWDVVEVLDLAWAIRGRFSGPNLPEPSVDTGHFLVAMLGTIAGQSGLGEIGILDAGIKPLTASAAEQLRAMASEPKGSEWEDLAIGLDMQGLMFSRLDELGASFDADRAERPAIDSLGFKEDAAALSNVILLRAARPPLAIGLFGAWGSGKSTMMRELQYRIHEDLQQEQLLRTHGVADHNPGTERITDVVQIEFNAWAFADSQNLWASLTSEIFDQLAAGGIQLNRTSGVNRRYESLVQEVKLRSSREASAIVSADDRISALKQRVNLAQEAVRSAIEHQSEALTNAAIDTTRQLLGAESPKTADKPGEGVAEQPKPKDRTASEIVKNAFGGQEPLEQSVRQYAEAAGDMVRLIRFTWDYLTKRPLVVVAAAILLAGGILALTLAPTFFRQMGTLPARWLAAAATLAGSAWVLNILLPALRFAALLNRRLRERREAAAALEAEARTRLEQLETELEQAEADRRGAQSWIEKYGLIEDATNAASPAMMLEYLITGSADVEGLRKQLGVIATVRRCFEQLDAIVTQMQGGEQKGARIDRIILYIDDLDRCTPEQVTQVLQAVHLLLAFECFVVIVAVDARWLKESLETSQAQLKPAAPPKAPDPQKVTASDYLEKIFQIAYWVRPLVDQDAPEPARYASYKSLVRALATPPAKTISAPVAPVDEPRVGTVEGVQGDSEIRWREPYRIDQTDARRRRGLELGEPEVGFIEAMAPMAAKSPRAVKRMINLYRLMRVRYGPAQLQQFLGNGGPGVPNFRELLFALAAEIGLSTHARESLRNHVCKPPPDAWAPKELETLFEPADREAFKAVLPELKDISFQGLFTAVEEVRRFSFLP